MSQRRIFVASSAEAIPHAKSFITNCTNQKKLTYVPWWDEFIPGRTLLEELGRFRNLDGALIIMTPDCRATIRGRSEKIPNLNVLYEFGYFYGVFQRKHVAVVKYGTVYLPSDLDGYIPIFGHKNFSRKVTRPTKRTQNDFFRWIDDWESK